jgi:hypothetical protein
MKENSTDLRLLRDEMLHTLTHQAHHVLSRKTLQQEARDAPAQWATTGTKHGDLILALRTCLTWPALIFSDRHARTLT